jgi:hypothetical protein
MTKYFLLILGAAILLNSCKKRIDDFASAPLSDYFPLQVGKHITYDLDSTVFINFGQRDTVIKYQVQDRVDAQITDNTGHTAFRILRFIRKNENQDWSPDNTFLVVPTENSIEFIENNLRFIKLALPVNTGYSWKGNSYIDTYSFSSGVRYLDGWEYTYDSINVPLSLGNITVDSTIKVAQIDEFLGEDPQVPGAIYGEKNYSVEKYAKGVGLIFKELIHWEYNGAQPGNNASYVGYGIRLSMIDHN